jgi:hypothetical protein
MLTCAQWFADITAQHQQQQHQQQTATQPLQGASTVQQQQQVVRVLIFNCMKERDPSVLLPQLHKELLQQGAPMQVALFVPPDSQYAFLPSSKTSALVAAVHQDLSWQTQLQGVWAQCEAAAQRQGAAAAAQAVRLLPPLPEVPGVLGSVCCAAEIDSASCIYACLPSGPAVKHPSAFIYYQRLGQPHR